MKEIRGSFNIKQITALNGIGGANQSAQQGCFYNTQTYIHIDTFLYSFPSLTYACTYVFGRQVGTYIELSKDIYKKYFKKNLLRKKPSTYKSVAGDTRVVIQS